MKPIFRDYSGGFSPPIRWASLTILALLLSGSGSLAEGVGLTRTVASGVPLLVIQADLNNPNVKVTGVVAQGGVGRSEGFGSMIGRTHPTAAVTGTFFSPGSLRPIGDLVVNGKLAYQGGVGTGFCLTRENQCIFIQPSRRYTTIDWGQFDFVCCSGPRLVVESQASVQPRAEGFRDPHLLGSATRLAVGLTAENKLLFVTTRDSISLKRMAMAMQKLGCTDAIALDAGSSLGFYHAGRMIARPKRQLTNAILIYDDRARYERFKERLTPTRVARRGSS